MKRHLSALLVVLPLLLLASKAYAGTATLTLTRVSLTNVTDAAGTWQYEGGQIFKGSTQVGDYAITRRVTTGGTTALNTAMLTITLFLTTATAPPDSITIQGAHDFLTGNYTGSVSATSERYSFTRGGNVSGSTATDKISVAWLGSNQLTLP